MGLVPLGAHRGRVGWLSGADSGAPASAIAVCGAALPYAGLEGVAALVVGVMLLFGWLWWSGLAGRRSP